MSLQQQSLPEPQTLTTAPPVTPSQQTQQERPTSACEKHAKAKANAREEEDARIEAAIAEFHAIKDPVVRREILIRAESKRSDEIAWSRSLDFKVSPILAVASFAIGGVATLLTSGKLMDGKPFIQVLSGRHITQALLVCIVLSLLYAVVKSVLVISPTLKVTEPVARVLGVIKIFPQRHLAHGNTKEWQGHLYFGHTANYDTAGKFIQYAIPHFQNEGDVLRDTLTQGYINARVCRDKCIEIALATRGILAAIAFALLATITFYFGL